MGPRTVTRLIPVVAVAAVAALSAQSAAAQQPARGEKLVTLTSLLTEGFEVKAATGNQSGVVGTLVLQKDKQVFLCSSKELTIVPLAFECWPLK